MATKRCNLLKITLLLLSLTGVMIQGFAQNALTKANQAEAQNTVIYNQSGIGISILIVFAVLIIVLVAFKYFGILLAGNPKKTAPSTLQPQIASATPADPQGEIHAAIAMALYLYSNELHDQENPVITMIRVSKTYSPWSSKIYGLRKSPR